MQHFLREIQSIVTIVATELPLNLGQSPQYHSARVFKQVPGADPGFCEGGFEGGFVDCLKGTFEQK